MRFNRIQFSNSLRGLLLAVLTLCSCTQQEAWIARQPIPADAVEVPFSFRVPGMSVPATRALTEEDENKIHTIHALVFRNNEYQYTTEGSVQADGSFMFRLPTGEVDLTFVANAEWHLNNVFTTNDAFIEPGTEKQTVLDELNTVVQTGAWPLTGDEKYLPMWAGREAVTISNTTDFSGANAISLLRVHASIDVVSVPSGFTITKIALANHSRYGTFWPDAANRDVTTNKVTTPTVPEDGYNKGSYTDYMLDYSASPVAQSVGEIYTLEAPAANDPVYGNNTCLLIQGAIDSGTPYWYRVDLGHEKADGSFEYIPLLRNHKYIITIKDINGAGYADAQAALNGSQPLRPGLITWDVGEIANVQYKNGYILGVSATAMTLPTAGCSNASAPTLTIVHNAPINLVTTGASNITETVNNSSTMTKTVYDITAERNATGVSRTKMLRIACGTLTEYVRITQNGEVTIRVITKSGKEITNNDEYSIRYYPSTSDAIDASFTVEWEPATLPLNIRCEDTGETRTYDRDLTLGLANSATNSGQIIPVTDETYTTDTGALTFRPRPRGISTRTEENTPGATTQIGSNPMAANIIITVGNKEFKFAMRAWTPYADWKDASGNILTALNFDHSTSIPTSNEYITYIHTNCNIAFTDGSDTFQAANADSAATYFNFNKYNTAATQGNTGKMERIPVKLNSPTKETWYKYANQTQSRTGAWNSSLENKALGTCALTVNTVWDIDKTNHDKVAYAYSAKAKHPVYVTKHEKHAWMNHDLLAGNVKDPSGKLRYYSTYVSTSGTSFGINDPCPKGMHTPTPDEINSEGYKLLLERDTDDGAAVYCKACNKWTQNVCGYALTFSATDEEAGLYPTLNWVPRRGNSYWKEPYVALCKHNNGVTGWLLPIAAPTCCTNTLKKATNMNFISYEGYIMNFCHGYAAWRQPRSSGDLSQAATANKFLEDGTNISARKVQLCGFLWGHSDDHVTPNYAYNYGAPLIVNYWNTDINGLINQTEGWQRTGAAGLNLPSRRIWLWSSRTTVNIYHSEYSDAMAIESHADYSALQERAQGNYWSTHNVTFLSDNWMQSTLVALPLRCVSDQIYQ